MQYEYFYGAQAEQFSFYRIPKALFTEPNFRELSTDAKVLYGILLDRMSLSLKNQWLDAQNKVYIKSGVPYDIEQEQTGKQDKESAGPDCATICRPQDFFLNMSRTKRKRKLVEWLESCQENQVNVLDEKIPLLSFVVDFVTAYEYQKARGIKIHPGLWKDMRVDIFLVKKEN